MQLTGILCAWESELCLTDCCVSEKNHSYLMLWVQINIWSCKSLSPLSSPIEMSCTEYSTIPETPEAQRTRKVSYFKRQRQRGVQFLDVSDSEDEEPRRKGTQAPRAKVALMYALSHISVLSLHPRGLFSVETLNENQSLGWVLVCSVGIQLPLTKLYWFSREKVSC